MRLLLALVAAASLVACSKNKTNVDTGPETGRAKTDTVRTADTVRTTGAATDTVNANVSGEATGTVTDTSASGEATGTATVDTSSQTSSPDTSKTQQHDSM